MKIRIPECLTEWKGPLDEDLTQALNKYMSLRTHHTYITWEIEEATQQKSKLNSQVEKARIAYSKIIDAIVREQSE